MLATGIKVHSAVSGLLRRCCHVSFAHIKLQATALFLRAKGKVKVTSLEWSSMVSPLGCALDVKFFSVLIPSARGTCYRSNLIRQDTVQESKVQISVFLISRSLAFFAPKILFLFYVYVCFHECVYSVCVCAHPVTQRPEGCKSLWK